MLQVRMAFIDVTGTRTPKYRHSSKSSPEPCLFEKVGELLDSQSTKRGCEGDGERKGRLTIMPHFFYSRSRTETTTSSPNLQVKQTRSSLQVVLDTWDIRRRAWNGRAARMGTIPSSILSMASIHPNVAECVSTAHTVEWKVRSYGNDRTALMIGDDRVHRHTTEPRQRGPDEELTRIAKLILYYETEFLVRFIKPIEPGRIGEVERLRIARRYFYLLAPISTHQSEPKHLFPYEIVVEFGLDPNAQD
ncbi:hypothetical protein BDN72DRAFT_947857 [Pluteus cervinus]|uniref:Uncharacterized protein n=1 Tax=Pluteus cervinus TaxID=181527 RepID=A0ACD3A161_9AGAR|nr:hypothetical protein BDN72DRAFT_947857 [Pluteus cervinus]